MISDMRRIIFILISVLFSLALANATVAYTEAITVRQPDGTLITIRMHGDEYLHWATCGNSLIAKGSDGYWRYATFESDGSSKADGAIVRSTSSGDGSGVTPPAVLVQKAMAQREMMTSFAAESANSSISLGEKHFLVLLIEFSDKDFSRQKSDFEDMLNGSNYTFNGAVGSVNKYYQDVSFKKFNPVYDVYGPIKVSGTSAEYAENDVGAVKEACTKVHDSLGVNFTNYCYADPSLVDNVFFFFPGYNQAEGGGSDTIWPHAVTYSSPFMTLDGVGIYKYGCASEYKGSSGATVAGIGTFCHEFGHIIGLPDLYDVGGSEYGSANALQTLSLMSNGNYNNGGRTPPYFTYEERHILGWDDGLTLLQAGENVLSKVSENKSYWSPTVNDGEYYLYESRPCEGWDKNTGAPGMAIYHVDRSDYVMPDGQTAAWHWAKKKQINSFASHQCMDLVESVSPESSIYYTNQFVFPGYNNVTTFSSETTPAAIAWSGVPTGYNLSNIAFSSSTGKTTFIVTKDYVLKGTVKAVSGEPISGAKIVINHLASQPSSLLSSTEGDVIISRSMSVSSSGSTQTAVSDADGHFSIKLSGEGDYSISASLEGYVQYADVVEVIAVSDINITMQTVAEALKTDSHKYNELNIDGRSVGYGANNSCEAAVAFSAEEMETLVGADISAISFVAYNNSTGTCDKVGVRVYFGNSLKCDKQVGQPLFGTICTVDISEYGLKIPNNEKVYFSYYIINPSYGYSLAYTDKDSPVTDGNLVRKLTSAESIPTSWATTGSGNFIISVRLIDNNQVFDVAGFNCIAKDSSYKSGDIFTLKLKESSSNPPSSVSWNVNGKTVTANTIPLVSGTYIIRANLTYPSGRAETVETNILVE